MVTVVVCMFFAAISGSAVATVSAVGAFMIPQMVQHGYSKTFSAALTAAAGTIGVIIPPSVPFVIYGVVSGSSITNLFTAGFLPGILMGVALMLVTYIVSKKEVTGVVRNGYPYPKPFAPLKMPFGQFCPPLSFWAGFIRVNSRQQKPQSFRLSIPTS